MDNKKNNMKQAMYEMFGVGYGAAEIKEASAEPKREKKPEVVETVRKAETKPVSASAPTVAKAEASYFGPDTVIEGTLRSKGDVEIAGEFKGNISTEGTVVLRSKIQGNVTSDSLQLSGCEMVGDVVVAKTVSISRDSSIRGNVTAHEVKCAGTIVGDLKVTENTVLDDTAQIDGNIVTGTIAVVKGAKISGGIEMNQKNNNKGGKKE